MPRELLDPVVDAGIRLTNFFNGRVLTAEDLRREQDAVRERHRGLAGAVGEGVVRGLEVTMANPALPAPSVRVLAGLAFNRDGNPVRLAQEVELRLIPAEAASAAAAGVFGPCETPAVEVEISNPGLYLLLVRPATAMSRDRVAAVDLAADGIGSSCGSRFSEEGVSFSLVSLALPTPSADSPIAQTLADLSAQVATDVDIDRRGGTSDEGLPLRLARNLSKLRSGVAFWLSGHDTPGERIRALAATAPGAASAGLSPLGAMRAAGRLASADVPLAVLHVSRRRLEWLDVWTVRRPPLPGLGPDPLSLVNEDRPRSDAVALVLQFRDHLSAFLAGDDDLPAPHEVVAPDWFLYLPPAGVLPVRTETAAGFDPGTFFPWLNWGTFRPDPIAKTRFEQLLREGLAGPPARFVDGKAFAWIDRFHTEEGETTDWENRFILFRTDTYGPYDRFWPR